MKLTSNCKYDTLPVKVTNLKWDNNLCVIPVIVYMGVDGGLKFCFRPLPHPNTIWDNNLCVIPVIVYIGVDGGLKFCFRSPTYPHQIEYKHAMCRVLDAPFKKTNLVKVHTCAVSVMFQQCVLSSI